MSSEQTLEYWQQRLPDDSQTDWPYSQDWIQGYWDSVEHPHRKLLIEELKKLEWDSLLEIGCNVGPNLALIHKEFENKKLSGIDPNTDAVLFGRKMLDIRIEIKTGDLLATTHEPCDLVLADAVLMYLQPEEINEAMDKLCSLAEKAVIIIDRYAPTEESNGHIWARDYEKLLTERGFAVTTKALTREDWPTSENWIKQGRIFVGTKL